MVIPVFNEEGCLRALHAELTAVMEKMPGGYEIIYIDDGSTDSSSEVLPQLTPAAKIISFPQNQGQSTALYAGFKAAQGSWIITLDADGQNPPQEIPRLLKARGGVDFVAGIRKARKDNWWRKATSSGARFFRWLVLGDKTRDTGCALRAFRREVVEALPLFRNFHRFFPFLARAQGFSVKEVSVEHKKRTTGSSKYGTGQRLWQGLFDLWGVFWLKRRLMRYEVKCRS